MTKHAPKPIGIPFEAPASSSPRARHCSMFPRIAEVEVVYRYGGRTYLQILDGEPRRALLVDRIDGRVLLNSEGRCPTPTELAAMIAARIVTRSIDVDQQSFPSALFHIACADFLHLVEKTRMRAMRSPATGRGARGRSRGR